jgi:hypothetical protein
MWVFRLSISGAADDLNDGSMRTSAATTDRSGPTFTPRRGALPIGVHAPAGLLHGVWERQRGLIGERVGTIERAVQAQSGGELDAETRQAAERAAHMLAGSLGTFGLADASRAAGELEGELADCRFAPDRAAYWQVLLGVVADAIAEGELQDWNTALTR